MFRDIQAHSKKLETKALHNISQHHSCCPRLPKTEKPEQGLVCLRYPGKMEENQLAKDNASLSCVLLCPFYKTSTKHLQE